MHLCVLINIDGITLHLALYTFFVLEKKLWSIKKLMESFILTAFFGLRKFSILYFFPVMFIFRWGGFFCIYAETIEFDPHSKEKTKLKWIKNKFRMDHKPGTVSSMPLPTCITHSP